MRNEINLEHNSNHNEPVKQASDNFFVMTERRNAQIAFKHWLRRRGVDSYDDGSKDKRGNALLRFYNQDNQKVGVTVCLCDKALQNAHEELTAYFGDDE